MVHGLEVAGRDSKSGCVRECFFACAIAREREREYMKVFLQKAGKTTGKSFQTFADIT